MSDSAGLKKELEAAIASYHKAVENVASFETKLREARKAEADATLNDAEDERKVIKAIAKSQALAGVYSRRLELAKEKVPQAFCRDPSHRQSSRPGFSQSVFRTRRGTGRSSPVSVSCASY